MNKKYVFKRIPKAIVEVDEDIIRLTRKGFFSFFMHGLKGQKSIPIKNITAVQLKKPGMTIGYIQFSQHGTLEDEGGIFGSMFNENSVTIRQREYKQAAELKEYIESFQRETSEVNNATINGADEIKKYKELMDSGAISTEEYECKKKKILNT